MADVCTHWFLEGDAIDGNSHFENLQSTNWNSLRFKNPPTEDSKIGWRVEFRTMDIQLTDFENAALTIAVGMIANIVNTFDVDFILPISLVDENMSRAHHRNSVCDTKIWWKVDAPADQPQAKVVNHQDNKFLSSGTSPSNEETQMSLDEQRARD